MLLYYPLLPLLICAAHVVADVEICAQGCQHIADLEVALLGSVDKGRLAILPGVRVIKRGSE